MIDELLATLLLGGAGLAMLATGVRDLVEGHASHRWPTAPGEILGAGVVLEEESRSPDELERRRGVVEYAYTVGTRSYVGGRIRAGGVSMRAFTGGISPRLWRYQLEPRVAVYYDPARPHRAVLEPGITARAWRRALLGALLVGMVLRHWLG